MNSMDSDPRARFLKSLEDYYRDTYPDPMKRRVFELLPKTGERLSALYEILIRDPEAWKRSVKVPDVVAIERARREMQESHPELTARGYVPQIEEEAGFTIDELLGEHSSLMEMVRARKEQVS